MMQGQHSFQVVRKVLGILRKAVCDMRNEVDQVVERDDAAGSGGRGRDQEDIALGHILLELVLKVFAIRSKQN